MKASRLPIWKSSLFLFFTQAIRLLTNIFIVVGIARLYGPEEFGQFSIAYTVATICIVIADFGFDVLLTTEIANNRDQAARIGKKYFSMKIIFALLGCLIMFAISGFNSFSTQSNNLIYALMLFVVFTTFINFYNAIFRGFEKFEYETKISFITNIIFLILFGVLGFLKISLLYLMLLFVASRLLGVILSARTAVSLVGSNFIGIDFKEWQSIINKILIYGIHFLFGNLFFQLDTILIGIWKGDHDVGIYKAAFNIMLLILIITDIAFSATLPVFSRLYNENNEKWKNLSRLYFKIFIIAALPITMIVYFYSEEIILIIYGKQLFNNAVPILRIFSIVILFRFIGEPYAMMLTTSSRQNLRMIIVVFATAVSFVLNYFVIPIHGLNGAALVSLGVNILVGTAYIFANNISYLKWIMELKIITIILAIVIISLLLNSYHSNLIILCVSLIIYAAISYFIVLSNSERTIIFTDLLPLKKRIQQ